MAVCFICNKTMKSNHGLVSHIKRTHDMTAKDYYDSFVKSDNSEGVCLECGKETSFIDLAKGYRMFCCVSCSARNGVIQKKRCETTKKHFGVEHPAQSDVVRSKQRNTCKQRYGIEYPCKKQEFKNKAKQTSMFRYGVDSFTKTEEYKRKTKETSLYKYGVESPNQSNAVREKQELSFLKKYGFRNPLQNEEVRNKQKETCIRKYGVPCYTQTSDYKEKSEKTSMLKYGVPNAMMCHAVVAKCFHKIEIGGKIYDSTWEYYYEQYLIRNNVNFEYHPDIPIWYFYKGKRHRYYPDFAILNSKGEVTKIVEIKGDHLLKSLMKTKSREYAKYLCMKENGVDVLMKKDLIRLGINLHEKIDGMIVKRNKWGKR